MTYESSYESGRTPYLPDSKRGKWLDPQDFICAGICLVFQIDIISKGMLSTTDSGFILFLPAYLLSIVLYIVPLMVLKSYMGQFSSTGFISAFRLSPMFKGIGYVSLMTNICVLAYHSIFAMVPLLYMFASMQPTLPWSCEGFKTWAQNLTEKEEINLCNIKLYTNETMESSDNYTEFINHHIPSFLYFQYMFHDAKIFHQDDFSFSMSWQLLICALIVWTIVSVIVFKFFQTETIGLLVRYSLWIILGLMAFFLVVFCFLPGASHVFVHMFWADARDIVPSLFMIPIFGISAFGPGWGMLITLSSFNKFNTHIIKSSCLIAVGQFGLLFGLDLLGKLSEAFIYEKTDGNYFSYAENIWHLYLSSGSVMAHMPWANLWSILFYFMLFLSSLVLMVLQLLSIITSIFDEFVSLREKRHDVTLALMVLLTALSLFFSSNNGLTYFSAISTDIFITQAAINLLLILIVLWIYGRERFQRDIEFMTDHRFSTWTVHVLRFVSPIGFVLLLIGCFMIASYEHFSFGTLYIDILSLVFFVIPWLSIPGYAIYQMCQSMGSIKIRFFRCCRPTDWFPLNVEDKQKYEAAIGSGEINHTLKEDSKEEEVI
ncbi:sodium-dependent neutral amino acid transporter SLC6A17 [Stomoxys calcitrans]|uniref:sodium-dependent neutral amino acid transporter SLC6A17 n=1 Tax=Stomoxys calcitrans TaxID=35570 RepID=UPI0027E3AEC5|nr:sodium-dependent neutral amino acid transporter SLC6A17 [Stomoxys calcitrans]